MVNDKIDGHLITADCPTPGVVSMAGGDPKRLFILTVVCVQGAEHNGAPIHCAPDWKELYLKKHPENAIVFIERNFGSFIPRRGEPVVRPETKTVGANGVRPDKEADPKPAKPKTRKTVGANGVRPESTTEGETDGN